jgi:Transposase DDE domain group 1
LLLAAIEQRLKIAERLAACIEDPRDPDRVVHEFAEMIRYRALLIAAGYPDGNDCDALRSDPAFKMAVGRLPESGDDLCSQPTISRLENLPGPTALKRMMAAMVDLFCDSFAAVPRRILLDIDDTEDRVHGGQQLSLVERPLRQPLLFAHPCLRGDDRQARRDHPASRQDARGQGDPRPSAPPDPTHPPALAGDTHHHPRRRPLRPSRGHGVVRRQCHRLCVWATDGAVVPAEPIPTTSSTGLRHPPGGATRRFLGVGRRPVVRCRA